jgi:hypothetical protein
MMITNRSKSFELFESCLAAHDKKVVACKETTGLLEDYVGQLIKNTVG